MTQKITVKSKGKRIFDNAYSTTYYKSYWRYLKALKRNNVIAFITILSSIVLILSSIILGRLPLFFSFLVVVLLLLSLFRETQVAKKGRLLKKDSKALSSFLGITTFEIYDGAYLLNTKLDEQSLEIVLVPRQAILRRIFGYNKTPLTTPNLEQFADNFESDIIKLLEGTAISPQNKKVYNVYGTIPISLLTYLKKKSQIKIVPTDERLENRFKLVPNKKDTSQQKPFLSCEEWKMVKFELNR